MSQTNKNVLGAEASVVFGFDLSANAFYNWLCSRLNCLTSSALARSGTKSTMSFLQDSTGH